MAKLVVVATLSAMFGALAGAACGLHAQSEDDAQVVTRDQVDDVLGAAAGLHADDVHAEVPEDPDALGESHVRLLVNRQDGPGRWTLG